MGSEVLGEQLRFPSKNKHDELTLMFLNTGKA